MKDTVHKAITKYLLEYNITGNLIIVSIHIILPYFQQQNASKDNYIKA